MVGVGQRIGNYRVQRKLGQGGMGAVFEVMHEEIGRRAAVKVLLQDFAKDRQSIQRFFNEARAVNIIHHPSLVGVFESGRLEDGSAFIIMEYLDGELLSARLKRIGSLSHPNTLSLGRQIASALAAAHNKGIVHRDLKPENVMIVADPETVDGERVKIFDFGLAKLRLTSLAPEGAGASGSFHTQNGALLGTPSHMAPEQCRGASEVDGKADVYSLGVMMFQMLVGHTPFLAKSVGELMSMHLRDKPPNLRRIDKSISVPLADLVSSMLAKEPTLRPEMLEIVQRLESLGAHRTRRVSTTTPPQSDPPLPVSADIEFARTQAAPSGDPPISAQASGQATAPTFEITTSARQYMLAVAVAAVLVLGSAAYLFADFWPREAPAVAPQRTVTWMIDSEPQGAELIRSDNGETLGRTPWYRTASAQESSLRLELRLAGYRGTTVIVNQSEHSNQKVSLEPIGKGAVAAPPPAPVVAVPPPAAPPAAPPTTAATVNAKRIRSTVMSQPTGAEVVRASDGKRLGKTPWTYEDVAHPGALELVVSLPGHISAGVDLDMQQSSQHAITLKRSVVAPKVSTPRPPGKNPRGRQDNIPYER